jgi:3-hydroxyacyl-CoA dehydrogenase/enoyl-CoA hydratase/3-hydroxybutyryl-CoA epimerase
MSFFHTDTLSVEMQDKGIAHLWLDLPGRTHNVFNRQLLADLTAAVDRVAAEPAAQALVFLSRKPAGFIAGADLHEFAKIQGPQDALALAEMGQQLMNKVEALRVPSVAVVHGPCLGGGLEFALACDYRIVLDRPGTQLGLPEIELGLVPGWGGTQRLPRVVGLERALQVILQRRRLDAREALRWGLADAVEDTQPNAVAYITHDFFDCMELMGKRPKKALPKRNWRQIVLESTPPGRAMIFRIAERVLRRRVPDDMPAPLEALRAVRVGLSQGVEAGLRYEREANSRLAGTPAARNLLTLFFLIERARKAPEGQHAEKVRRVGVVGAGTMGAGIVQLAAVKGFGVAVREVNDAALAAGMKKIEDLFQKAADKGVLSKEEADKQLADIGRTTAWDGFDDVDVAIEAVIEDLDLKRQVFRALDERARPDTILATNTSSLAVKQLQEGVSRPQRVAGLHFFNPVHKMPLVEVVRTPATDAAAVARLVQFAAALGKTPVVVGDSPGFVVNRVLFPYLNEAGVLLAEGMPVEWIDQTMRKFGMPMGPLELLDQVGLDVAAHIARAVGPAFGGRIKPHPDLQIMVEFGWLGQKSGQGFYRYRGKKKTVNAEALAKLGRQVRLKATPEMKASWMREARERMVLLMVNEAAACLSEGLAERADVIDLALVLGTGWAPHRGGPLRYADDRGVDDVVKALDELSQRRGPRFTPCAELRRRAETKEAFYRTLPALQPA